MHKSVKGWQSYKFFFETTPQFWSKVYVYSCINSFSSLNVALKRTVFVFGWFCVLAQLVNHIASFRCNTGLRYLPEIQTTRNCWFIVAASCPISTARLRSILHCFCGLVDSDASRISSVTGYSLGKLILLGMDKRFTVLTLYRCLQQFIYDKMGGCLEKKFITLSTFDGLVRNLRILFRIEPSKNVESFV